MERNLKEKENEREKRLIQNRRKKAIFQLIKLVVFSLSRSTRASYHSLHLLKTRWPFRIIFKFCSVEANKDDEING